MEMERTLVAGVLTAGAGLLGLWYLYNSENEKDSVLLGKLKDEFTALEDDIKGLKKKLEVAKTENELQEFAEGLARLKNEAKERKVLKIGTRDSVLAMWQAKHVQEKLRKLHPELKIEIVGMKTLGDKDLKSALSTFSNKGVFTKELDVALLNGSVDIAVHSMKDLPTILESGLAIACVLERGSTEDAVVFSSKHKSKEMRKLDDLPSGSVIGTSALRRTAMLHRHFPTLKVENIRGNLQTRFKKLDDEKKSYDALILARTGLQRIELDNRINEVLDVSKYGYAVAQGALAVVCRRGDTFSASLLSGLMDEITNLRTTAERALLRTLEGGCKVPIAVFTNHDEKTRALKLKAWVTSLDGKNQAEAEKDVEIDSTMDSDEKLDAAEQLGVKVAKELIAKGAEEILKECRGMPMGHKPPT